MTTPPIRLDINGPTSRTGIGRLKEAIERSWDRHTAYQGVTRPNNPAYGQCYPTSRVVQHFYPEAEIACGEVWTGRGTECHFWNIVGTGDDATWIDLSWQQFPPGSVVQKYRILDRNELGDSPATIERCALLLRRVMTCLQGEEPFAGERI
jgi:hypothetical protein